MFASQLGVRGVGAWMGNNLIVVFADYHGVNNPTMDDFKLPTWP